jgi:hypothetical protein
MFPTLIVVFSFLCFPCSSFIGVPYKFSSIFARRPLLALTEYTSVGNICDQVTAFLPTKHRPAQSRLGQTTIYGRFHLRFLHAMCELFLLLKAKIKLQLKRSVAGPAVNQTAMVVISAFN